MDQTSPTLNATQGSDLGLLAALFHATALLAAPQDLHVLAETIAITVTDLLPDVDYALLWLHDPTDERLHLASLHAAAMTASGQPPILDGMEQLAIRPGEGGVGQAFATGEPVLRADAFSLSQDGDRARSAFAELLRSRMNQFETWYAEVSVPLVAADDVLGVLQLINTGGVLPLREDTLPAFQTWTKQAALALQNTQLRGQLALQNRRLQAFDALVTAITGATDLSQLLERALQVVLDIANVSAGAVGLLDGASGLITLEAHQQLAVQVVEPLRVIPVHGSPYEQVIRAMEPTVQALGPDHPWQSILRQGPAAGVGFLPLRAGDSVVGVLLFVDRLAKLQRLNWSLLGAMGAPIGFAVATARLLSVMSSERRRLSSVIASIAEGVILCNAQGEIILANEAASALFQETLLPGMTLDTLTTAYAFRDQHDLALDPATSPLGRALRGEVFHDLEVLVRRSDGRDLVLSASGAPLFGSNNNVDGAVVVLRNITEHKAQDAARDEFLAVAAHELRSPLAAIKGYTDLLVRRETSRPDATERDLRGIQMLARQVDHLVLLINNLLDLSRLDTGHFKLLLRPTDLMTIIESSAERVRAGGGRHPIEIQGPETCLLEADELRLEQVFTNLIGNAARYSPPDSPIVVTVRVDRSAGSTGVPRAVVAVTDRGPGVTPEAQSRIFDRYYRAPSVAAVNGLGLGLYLSREIVLLHGGRIWVESIAGQGATFLVELPLRVTSDE